MLKKSFWLTAVLILSAVILAACGGGNDEQGKSAENAEETITIEAANWKFDQDEYTIPADTDVAIELKNAEGIHGVMIEGEDINIEGDEAKVVNLKPGEYTLRCSVACGTGHAEMVSKLVVK
jgi:cytochrome c oxidase subunit II